MYSRRWGELYNSAGWGPAFLLVLLHFTSDLLSSFEHSRAHFDGLTT
jgi:hypothetical protein